MTLYNVKTVAYYLAYTGGWFVLVGVVLLALTLGLMWLRHPRHPIDPGALDVAGIVALGLTALGVFTSAASCVLVTLAYVYVRFV